ncbi:XRE family transcriptional regulator [Edaphobacter sp. DSM 109919]|uniref:XRE family transcriptional regulator n=1 Tax=Edaphobacter paludis TaxID=3035702 RepID=A0AAU7CT09_9BACT
MIGSRIKLAREIAGLTQTELAERIGTTQSGIASMEANLYRPSSDYLKILAKQTGFGLAFFEPTHVDEFPSGALLYRARTALSKSERQHAHGLTSVAFELAVFLGAKLKQVPVNLPRLKESPEKAAQITRTALGIAPHVPVVDLMQRAERNGVLILLIPREISTLDGFATWVGSPYPRPVIALLGGKVGYRVNFTLGEEIGHLVLHSPLTVSVVEADNQARAFAQELLLPKEAMLEEMRGPITLTNLATLKPRWNVSLQMLIRRASDLKLITPNQYRYLNQQVRTSGWTQLEPGDENIPQPKPRLMRKMAELRYGNPIDLAKLSGETGIPLHTVAELLGVEAPKRRGRVLDFKPRAQ